MFTMTGTEKVSVPDLDGGLDNKVSVVTGASRGNGEAQAKVLANAGSTVYAVDVVEDQLGQTVEDIRDNGGTAHKYLMDVSVEDNWEGLVDHITENESSLDVLVNNAGIASLEPATEETEETWDKVLDVNLKGTWLGMKHSIPFMSETGGGSVINISSVYGLRSSFGGESTAYQASKGGVTLVTKNAANAYADQGVRVNSVHPGYIETPMTEDADELQKVFLRDTPMDRSGSPEEVGRAVYFLASDLSSYITGENLVVDGGYLSH